MDAYIFQAALWCEDCATAIKQELGSSDASESEDSGDYPQGPYGDGGGEADCPQHCDHCGAFLENPLTSDGYDYVLSAIVEHVTESRGDSGVLRQWWDAYHSGLMEDVQDAFETIVGAKLS